MALYMDGATYDSSTCSWVIVWKNYDTDWPGITDGTDIADELTRINFGSYEGDPPDPANPPIPD